MRASACRRACVRVYVSVCVRAPIGTAALRRLGRRAWQARPFPRGSAHSRYTFSCCKCSMHPNRGRPVGWAVARGWRHWAVAIVDHSQMHVTGCARASACARMWHDAAGACSLSSIEARRDPRPMGRGAKAVGAEERPGERGGGSGPHRPRSAPIARRTPQHLPLLPPWLAGRPDGPVVVLGCTARRMGAWARARHHLRRRHRQRAAVQPSTPPSRPCLAWPGPAWPGLAWPGLAWPALRLLPDHRVPLVHRVPD